MKNLIILCLLIGLMSSQSTKAPIDWTSRYATTTNNTTLSTSTDVYIHTGGAVTYTLPSANSCTGKSWKIVNQGSGTITMSASFYVDNTTRASIINREGANMYEIFSDGTNFRAIAH